MTKCGRYGPSAFDYKPATIRESVERSLKRLHTEYLDTVFLHDVEFVCTQVAPRATGDNSTALDIEAPEFGLAEGKEAKIHGDGDQKILDAFAELRKMKEEGLIKNIGITGWSLAACNVCFAECFLGYPLPTLLRLALCILHNPPYEPVDVILSYSHLNLQNSTFLAFAPHLTTRAKVKQLLAASPLSMGLLTPSPPQWHPAPPPLKSSAAAAGKLWDKGLPDLALGYAIRFAEGVPLVAGFSSPEEVHHCLRISKEVSEGDNKEKRVEAEQLALATFRDAGYLRWSWSSP